MDDDRLARAREGDLDAFLDLVNPRAGRLVRLAAIGAGDPAAAHRGMSTAVRTVWRNVRRLSAEADLERALEEALVAALPRRRVGAPTGSSIDPLACALRALPPADRVALARCLDPVPDAGALAIAGRLGAEVGRGGAGIGGGPSGAVPAGPAAAGPRPGTLDPTAEIVDLDGPLVGWDLAHLRAALAAAALAGSPGNPATLVDELRTGLAGTRPDAGAVVAVRAAMPGPTGLARGAALVLVAITGIGILLASAGGTVPGSAPASPATASSNPVAGATDAPGVGRGDAAWQDAAAALADFPDVVEGLAVVGVAEARRLARDPAAAGRSIAIRGWLTEPMLRDPCLAPSPATPGRAGMPALDPVPVAVTDPISAAAAFCRRTSVLSEAPGAGWGGAHLHPQLLPGTGLGRARRLFATTSADPLPVVVLAHFGDPRAASCSTGGRHCGEEPVIERIAWIYGASARPAVAVRPAGPTMETVRTGWEAMDLAEAAYGGIRAVAVAGVPAADLATVEPAAAAVPSPSGFSWLVRAIVEPQPRDPTGARRTWLVVDDRTGEVVAEPGAVAAATPPPATGYLFPRRVVASTVRSVAELLALADAGMPDGTAIAVAGWLGTPALAGSCLAGPLSADPRPDDSSAFCRREVLLRGPTPTGRSLALQLAPGTPSLPIADAVREGRVPVPVVALVVSGSPRSEPCWPTDDGCGRQLLLERLLWVDGAPTDPPVAELDLPGLAPPRLSADRAGEVAARATGGRQVVSIVRVPAGLRGAVAPGSQDAEIDGDHAWVVHVRSPLRGPTSDEQAGLEVVWWVLVDDATGRTSTGARPPADQPDLPPPATPPG